MARNWKSEGVIEEMKVIKLPRTIVYFLDNAFYFHFYNGCLSIETEDLVTQTKRFSSSVRPLQVKYNTVRLLWVVPGH